MREQNKIISQQFALWKGDLVQADDGCVSDWGVGVLID